VSGLDWTARIFETVVLNPNLTSNLSLLQNCMAICHLRHEWIL
jgi:hypothetical protein